MFFLFEDRAIEELMQRTLKKGLTLRQEVACMKIQAAYRKFLLKIRLNEIYKFSKVMQKETNKEIENEIFNRHELSKISNSYNTEIIAGNTISQLKSKVVPNSNFILSEDEISDNENIGRLGKNPPPGTFKEV